MSFMFGGGGGGGNQSYYDNIANDIKNQQQGMINELQAERAELSKEKAKRNAEAKLLQHVSDNQAAIRRANPIPFMTTGWSGIPSADSRLLGGSAWTLG